MILKCYRRPERWPSGHHVIGDSVLCIFLRCLTFPLSDIARVCRPCQTPWLSQWMLRRGCRTAIGISRAVGGQKRSWQRSHGHIGSRTDSLEVGPVPGRLPGGWAAPVPITVLLWSGYIFLCSFLTEGEFPFCRGGWCKHIWADELLLTHPHTAEKCCHNQ